MIIKMNMNLTATIEIGDLVENSSRAEDTRKSETKVGKAAIDLKLDGGMEFDCSDNELKVCGDIYKSMQHEFTAKFEETSQRLEELEQRLNNSACKCKHE